MTSVYVFPTFVSTLKWENFTPQKKLVQNSEDFKNCQKHLEITYLSKDNYQEKTFLFQWQPTDKGIFQSYENCIASNNVKLELVMWNLKDTTVKLNKLQSIDDTSTNGNKEKGHSLQSIFCAIQDINKSVWWEDDVHAPVKENVTLSWAAIQKNPDLKLKAKIPWLICPVVNQFLLCWLHAKLLRSYLKANPPEKPTFETNLENEISIFLILDKVKTLENFSDAIPENFKHALNNEILHHLCTVYIWYAAFIKKQPGNNAAHAVPFFSSAAGHTETGSKLKHTLSPKIFTNEFCTKINSEYKKTHEEALFCGYRAVETNCIDTIQNYASKNERIQKNISLDFLNNTLKKYEFVPKEQTLLY